ncbi:MAG: type pilus assembly protein PilB, partial [Actinomycetota bacterium]|nr:type pilus assembly protein PilB [Actinomycetota bacterium]
MKRSRARDRTLTQTRPSAVLVPDVSVTEPRIRLGDLLVQSGAVSREALENASHLGNGQRIGSVLIEHGLLLEEDVTRALSEQMHVPVVDLRDAHPESAATALVESPDAHAHDVLPLVYIDGILTVAIADPLDSSVMALLRSLPVDEVHVALGVPSQLRSRVNRTYSALSAVTGDIEAFQAYETALEPTSTIDEIVDSHAPIVQVVNKIVTQALRDRASDVHLEPAEHNVRVRFRIDGALSEVVELPSAMGQALVSRIKIMADMNIVERRRPQDGQFEMKIDGRDLDVRVSTTSTIWGEKTVLRLLDRTRSLYRLADLGMPHDSGALYSRLVNSPYGMIIVGGPTGSGKTTTLYATLSEINRPDINVMTIED